jgi:hypothetical protein
MFDAGEIDALYDRFLRLAGCGVRAVPLVQPLPADDGSQIKLQPDFFAERGESPRHRPGPNPSVQYHFPARSRAC